MRDEFQVERHVGKKWVPTTSFRTKTEGLENLNYFRQYPLEDAKEYRLVKIIKEEVAWVHVGESVLRS